MNFHLQRIGAQWHDGPLSHEGARGASWGFGPNDGALRLDGPSHTLVTGVSMSARRGEVGLGIALLCAALGAVPPQARAAERHFVGWGDGSYGQTELPPNVDRVVSVAAGWDQSVALRDDGTVVVWGGRADPVPADLGGVSAIAAGAGHTLALKNDGTVVAWGYDA